METNGNVALLYIYVYACMYHTTLRAEVASFSSMSFYVYITWSLSERRYGPPGIKHEEQHTLRNISRCAALRVLFLLCRFRQGAYLEPGFAAIGCLIKIDNTA